MVFSNTDEELERMRLLKEEIEQWNEIEADKLFLGVKKLAEMLECSERSAREFMDLPGFPLLKIGNKPKVNVFALNEFTQQRIVMSEITKRK